MFDIREINPELQVLAAFYASERLMPAKAFAALLGIKPETEIQMRARRQSPPFYRVGGAVVYRWDDVAEWLQQQRFEPEHAALRVLEPEIDTSKPEGRIILTTLSMVAEMEVQFIKERQRAGIEAAKAKGIYKGRKRTIGSSASGGGDIPEEGRRTGAEAGLLKLVRSFVNVRDLDIDLIDQINPFQSAYEILSKDLDTKTLAQIQTASLHQEPQTKDHGCHRTGFA